MSSRKERLKTTLRLGKRSLAKRRGRRKKPVHMKVGTMYWEGATIGSRRRYILRKVTSPSGGVSNLSSPMTLAEARAFAEGWNKRYRRGKRLMPPRR